MSLKNSWIHHIVLVPAILTGPYLWAQTAPSQSPAAGKVESQPVQAPTSGKAGAQQAPASGKPGSSQVEATIQKSEDRSERKVQSEKLEGVPFAEVVLEPKSGSKVKGTVQFNLANAGLKVNSDIDGGSPGKHGIHIHEKGDCSAADASSAGGHFNPMAGKHAGPEHAGRHVGDLGNITVQQDGKGLLAIDVAPIKGFDWSQIVGKSVVVHEKGDDYKTQPTGDSGGRIACGIIKAVGKGAH